MTRADSIERWRDLRRRLSALAPKVAPWAPCPCCDNYLCNLHGSHAHDCPCPPAHEWVEEGLNPYAPAWLQGDR